MPIFYLMSPSTGDGKSMLGTGLMGAFESNGKHGRTIDFTEIESNEIESNKQVFGDPVDFLRKIPLDSSEFIFIEVSDRKSLMAAYVNRPGAVIAVTRGRQADDSFLNALISEVGPIGVVENCSRLLTGTVEPTSMKVKNATLCGSIPGDSLLASPSLESVTNAIAGNFSGSSEECLEPLGLLQIGPVTAHDGQDYFRDVLTRSVITRHDKIDIALSALTSGLSCLILTGGKATLPYVSQWAESDEFSLITSPLSTCEAIDHIAPLYNESRFQGRLKSDRAIKLIETYIDLTAIVGLVVTEAY